MLHKLEGKFVWLDLLCIVGRKIHVCTAYTASNCFLVEVDLAVGVHSCFAVRAVKRDVIDRCDCCVLERSIVEGRRDSALALEYFSVGSIIVYEAERIGALYVFVCHY